MIDKILCALFGANLYIHAYADNYNFAFWLTLVALFLTIILNDDKKEY